MTRATKIEFGPCREDKRIHNQHEKKKTNTTKAPINMSNISFNKSFNHGLLYLNLLFQPPALLTYIINLTSLCE